MSLLSSESYFTKKIISFGLVKWDSVMGLHNFPNNFWADFYISKTHLSIYDGNVSSWWGFSCGGWRKYVKTRISWRPHNLILPVQAMVAQFGDPRIKPVLGFHLKQWTRGEGSGETDTLFTTDIGKWFPRIMAEKLLKSNFTFKW